MNILISEVENKGEVYEKVKYLEKIRSSRLIKKGHQKFLEMKIETFGEMD